MVEASRPGYTPKIYRYAVQMPSYGLSLVAEIESCFTRSEGIRHHHATAQVVIVLDGEMVMQVGSRTDLLVPGMLLVIPAMVQHRVQCGPSHRRACYLDLRLHRSSAEPLRDFLDRLPSRPLALDRSAVLTRADALRSACMTSERGAYAAVMAQVWSLLSLAETGGDTRGQRPVGDLGSAEDPRLGLAEGYMRARLSLPFSMRGLTDAVDLSRSQIWRLFRQHRGATPSARLQALRIEAARELLVGSSISIKEIAKACGFSCPNHFSRVFSRLTGVSPSAFRHLPPTTGMGCQDSRKRG